MKTIKGMMAAALVAGVAIAPAAYAQSTISNRGYTVGIGTNGELFNSNTRTGFQRTSDGFDPILPGTPRDSWGVSTAAGSAYADQNYAGTSGITGTMFTGTSAATTAVSSTSFGLTVSQAYSFIAPNVLQIATTVTNTTAAAVDALFQRTVDLDVDYNYGGDTVATFGTPAANVVDTTNNGFDVADPAQGYNSSCSGAGCTATGDLGGGIKINLGSLAAGGSSSFNYYYAVGSDVTSLVSQVTSLGVSYGVADSFGGNSALIGVGSPIAAATPEPGTWLMMIVGFGVVGFALRSAKRRSDDKFDAKIKSMTAAAVAA